jgi:predicted MFS family arabinose efflux permease
LPLLLPVLAVSVLHIDARTLGFLFSAAGVGAVSGAVFLAAFSGAVSKKLIVFFAFAIWTISFASIGLSKAVVVTFVSLIGVGAAQSVIGAMTSTLLQMRVRREQRGRVMSLNTLLIMGIRPLGDFPAGALISILGAPFTAMGSAGVVGLTALFLLSKHRSVY